MGKTITAIWFLANLVGCINLGHPMGMGPQGILYSNFQLAVSPLHQNDPHLPETLKTGKSCVERLGFFYTRGDASLESAMQKGSITIPYSLDREVLNYAWIYGRVCTVVRGT